MVVAVVAAPRILMSHFVCDDGCLSGAGEGGKKMDRGDEMEMEMVPDRKQAEKGKCNQQQGKRERKKETTAQPVR